MAGATTSTQPTFDISNPSTLPQWAQTLIKRPLVEIRRGISLDFAPPTETSSVIALTAPSGKYVDIRFSLLADAPDHSSKKSDKINGWATAGVSTPSILPGTESCLPYESLIQMQWKHWIDSSGQLGEDKADMYLLSNGDVMEVGTVTMRGEVKMFKEYWIKPPPTAKLSPCIVMELVNSASGQGRGLVVRIGDYCQGIVQDGEDFWFERWQIPEGKSSWKRDERSNVPESGDVMPCVWATTEAKKLGDKVTIGGKEWEVTEWV